MNTEIDEGVKLGQFYKILEGFVFRELSEKLSPKLKYHVLNHTKDVIEWTVYLLNREKIYPWNPEFWVGKAGALVHDTGYLSSPLSEGHEERSIVYSTPLLISNGFGKYVNENSGISRATKIPQKPTTLLEQIVGDADVANFGRDDFFRKGDLLREELKNLGSEKSDKDWYKGVLYLLTNLHEYHTKSAKEIFSLGKEENIRLLKEKIEKS